MVYLSCNHIYSSNLDINPTTPASLIDINFFKNNLVVFNKTSNEESVPSLLTLEGSYTNLPSNNQNASLKNVLLFSIGAISSVNSSKSDDINLEKIHEMILWILIQHMNPFQMYI